MLVFLSDFFGTNSVKPAFFVLCSHWCLCSVTTVVSSWLVRDPWAFGKGCDIMCVGKHLHCLGSLKLCLCLPVCSGPHVYTVLRQWGPSHVFSGHVHSPVLGWPSRPLGTCQSFLKIPMGILFLRSFLQIFGQALVYCSHYHSLQYLWWQTVADDSVCLMSWKYFVQSKQWLRSNHEESL